MKYHVDDQVVALSGDYAHKLGTIIAVVPVAAKREPTSWLYRVRFKRGVRWITEPALRPPFKHEREYHET